MSKITSKQAEVFCLLIAQLRNEGQTDALRELLDEFESNKEKKIILLALRKRKSFLSDMADSYREMP